MEYLNREIVRRQPIAPIPCTLTEPTKCFIFPTGDDGDKDKMNPTTGSGDFVFEGVRYKREGIEICGFANPLHDEWYINVKGELSDESISSISSYKYTGACPLPVGYFDDGATSFFTTGNGTFCGFPNSESYDVHKRPGFSRFYSRFGTIDIDPSKFMSYTGSCPLHKGYFNDGGTTYYSTGSGTFCGFPNSESYDAHRRATGIKDNFGRIVAPNSFMNYTGACG